MVQPKKNSAPIQLAVPYNMDWSGDGSLLLTPSHQILTPEGELIADWTTEDYLTNPSAWIPPAWSRAFAARNIPEKPEQMSDNYELSPGGRQLAYSTNDDQFLYHSRAQKSSASR
jgi:hypothetical protein